MGNSTDYIAPANRQCFGRRRAGLLTGAAVAAFAASGLWRGGTGAARASSGPVPGKAGMLITGQSNAGFFLEDGGIWTLNEGLAALLGIERARFDPRLDGFRTIDGYALRDGAHRSPAMATTYGGTPLWAPGDRGAFLAHQAGADPSRWGRGAAGQGLDRFVRELLTDNDRADCLGILWLHTEDDSRGKRMRDAATHAEAIKRHLALIRAAFGRPATGPGELPAYAWAPIPYGDSAEGHRAVRAALAAVEADPRQNFRLAVPQTADSEGRNGGRDWSHRDPEDLRAFARRAAYAIAHDQRERRGLFSAGLPGTGPRIMRASAPDPRTTLVTVVHDRGRSLKASRGALDGRGWSVLDEGRRRAVTAIELRGGDGIVLRHEPCAGPPERREVGYCLFGEQLGRGNAVTDDWGGRGQPPRGLDAAWRFDFPLQATLLPVAVRD
jgi:GAF domain-containing protein